MTKPSAPCLGGPGYVALPTAEITIDGTATDWIDVAPVAADQTGDQVGGSASDMIGFSS